MKVRAFPIDQDLPAWRLLTGLVLAFLPFSALAASILTGAFLISGDGGFEVLLPALVSMVGAGVLHELGHWLGSLPGGRPVKLITTPGLSTIRLGLEPDLPAGSPRWLLRMLGGSLANAVAVAALFVVSIRIPELQSDPWIIFGLALNFLTAVVNLVPFRTGFTGPSDGWLILQGLRERRTRPAAAPSQSSSSGDSDDGSPATP